MRVWTGRPAMAALGVIAVTLVWRGVLLRDSFFNQDDFYLSARAYDADLSWSFLFSDTAGHVNPLQQLAYWVVANHAPYQWGAVATFVLAMQLLAIVVLWHVLSRLLPGQWVRVPLLAVFAWSPLSLMTTLWWSAAMGLWPHVICSLLAVLFLVRAHQGVGLRWLNYVAVLVATATGLLWHERAVLIAPVLVATAVTIETVPNWRRVPAALRRHWPLWASLGLLTVGYLVGHAALTSVEGGGSDLGESASISWAFFGQNVLPGLASGPWAADLRGGAVEPHLWVTIVSGVLFLCVVGAVLWRGGPDRRWALAFFVAYVASDLALVLAGRGGFGRLIGLDPRYSSDVVHAAVLCLALGLRGAPAHYGVRMRGGSWRRQRTLVLGSATAAYLAGAAVASALLVPHFQNTEDRAFLTTLRADLAADPNQVIVDDYAPADVVLPLVGDDSLYSRVLAPLPEAPVVDEPSPRMRTVAEDGHLLEVVLDGAVVMRPGPDEGCGYGVRRAGTLVRFAAEVAGRVVVHIGYFTDRESTVTVRSGAWSTRFLARVGPNELWFALPDLGRPVTSLALSADGGATVCVTSLEAGLPVRR